MAVTQAVSNSMTSISTSRQIEKDRKSGQRRIKMIKDFKELYEIGEEVIPNQLSAVRFGRRKSDGQEVVIKTRCKKYTGYMPNSTEGRREKQWRENITFMLNIPQTPGVVELYEVLEDISQFYVVMERAKGVDIFELIHNKQGRKITANASKEIIEQLLQAIKHVHDLGAIHRDIKLENVVVDYDAIQENRQHVPVVPQEFKLPEVPQEFNSAELVGQFSPHKQSCESVSEKPSHLVKIVDFDTIKEWNPTAVEPYVLGTDQYIAQEGYGGCYSPRSDIFSAGVIAFRLLTGKFPFHKGLFDDEPGENKVGSPKMEQIRQRLRETTIDWSHDFFKENKAAKHLLKQMLSHEESQRPTAAQCLSNPWITGQVNQSTKALQLCDHISASPRLGSNAYSGSIPYGGRKAEIPEPVSTACERFDDKLIWKGTGVRSEGGARAPGSPHQQPVSVSKSLRFAPPSRSSLSGVIGEANYVPRSVQRFEANSLSLRGKRPNSPQDQHNKQRIPCRILHNSLPNSAQQAAKDPRSPQQVTKEPNSALAWKQPDSPPRTEKAPNDAASGKGEGGGNGSLTLSPRWWSSLNETVGQLSLSQSPKPIPKTTLTQSATPQRVTKEPNSSWAWIEVST